MKTKALDNAALEEMSFEEALGQLEAIVKKLETGAGSLESSIEDYVKGTTLKEHCYKKLQDAKLKVDKIIQNQNGTIATEPFPTEE